MAMVNNQMVGTFWNIPLNHSKNQRFYGWGCMFRAFDAEAAVSQGEGKSIFHWKFMSVRCWEALETWSELWAGKCSAAQNPVLVNVQHMAMDQYHSIPTSRVITVFGGFFFGWIFVYQCLPAFFCAPGVQDMYRIWTNPHTEKHTKSMHSITDYARVETYQAVLSVSWASDSTMAITQHVHPCLILAWIANPPSFL
jgi:hypothetical protein